MNNVDNTNDTPTITNQPNQHPLYSHNQPPSNNMTNHVPLRDSITVQPTSTRPYLDLDIDFLKIKSVDDYYNSANIPNRHSLPFSANERINVSNSPRNINIHETEYGHNVKNEALFSRKEPNRISLRTQQLMSDAQVRLLNQYNSLKEQRRKSNQAKKDKKDNQKEPTFVKVWISDDNHRRPSSSTSFPRDHTNSDVVNCIHTRSSSKMTSLSQTDILKDGTTLYEDRFCRLSHTHLLLKTYYFPFFNANTIAIPDIEALFYDDQLVDCIHTRGWGCSFTGTWWGCDMGRDCGGNPESVNVVLDIRGQATYKGFTVRDFEAFFTALRAVIDKDIPVINGIP